MARPAANKNEQNNKPNNVDPTNVNPTDPNNVDPTINEAQAVINDAEKQEEMNSEAIFAKAKAEAIKKAKTLKVVTVICNDPDEASKLSSVYVACENQHLNVAKFVPLNQKVELEQCIIDTMRESLIPLHQEDPTTGVCITRVVNRYSISEH